MTCAKKRVVCRIVSPSGNVYEGTNDCRNPQDTCPRLPGEGYAKCKSICDQYGHAEEVALERAGDDARGATAFVSGIGWFCRACQEKLFRAGVKYLGLGEKHESDL